MINIAERFEKLIVQAKMEQSNDVYKLESIYFQKPFILIGVDLLDFQRRIYIDVTDEGWDSEQLKSFPKWRGIAIDQEYFERIGPLKEKTFLIISQSVEDSEEIFEKVLQNLVDHILMQEQIPLYTVVYEILDRWHNFFKRKYEKQLTLEEEMGLFGELYYIKRWLVTYAQEPPLIIKDWKGPLKNRIDFVNKSRGVEIKTVSPKIRDEIRISSEKQLEVTPVINDLHLYVLKIEISESIGQTLQIMIEEIESILLERAPSLAVKFKDLLLEIGVTSDDYDSNFFYVHEELVYQVRDSFPRITSESLPIGISNVSYTIDLSHCNAFKIPIEAIFDSNQ